MKKNIDYSKTENEISEIENLPDFKKLEAERMKIIFDAKDKGRVNYGYGMPTPEIEHNYTEILKAQRKIRYNYYESKKAA